MQKRIGLPPEGVEQRYFELDSLRGVAALTVVFHHFRLMWEDRLPHPAWVCIFDPVTAGHEAVMLFFLLSGFVLSLPYLRGKGQPYPIFLLRRTLRLYGPYVVALLISVAGAMIWNGRIPGGAWANIAWTEPVTRTLVVQNLLMFGKGNWNHLNLTFWTLVLEMRVSIVFPFLYLLVRRVGSVATLFLAVAGTCLGDFALHPWPSHLSWRWTFQAAMIFVVGILLAEHIAPVSAWYRSLNRLSRLAFLVGTVLFYQYGHLLGDDRIGHIAGLDQLSFILGSAGYMILALNAPWARAALSTRVAKFLGRISFSLYLMHSTVLLALTRVLGFRVSVPIQFVLYLAITVLLSYLFCLFVEEPFLRLSRDVASLWKKRQLAKLENVPVRTSA